MQKKINFNVPVLALDGSHLTDGNKELTLGAILSPVIAQQTKGDALKLFGWAIAIYKNEDLILDKSDQNMLKDFINSSENMTVLVKAQLLEVFNK
jgi:hypothetical protein